MKTEPVNRRTQCTMNRRLGGRSSAWHGDVNGVYERAQVDLIALTMSDD